MGKIELRKVTPSDVRRLHEISRQTFSETFSEENSEENMQQYVQENLSTEKLILELNDECSEFYFAMLDDRVIGYLKINFARAQTEIKDENALEIERIYVKQECQDNGVGQLLYEKAKEIATERKAEYIWLGVWEHNLKAINFYRKNGFIVFNKHVFRLGKDQQTDLMMKLPLNNND
jgi:ribosomal protein S18 acetylase RimI-like enzyme